MQRFILGLRLVYGLLWTVFGINFFFNFLANPEMSKAGMSIVGAIYNTGYMLPMVKIIELACGLLLLSGFYVPLSLVLLAPVLVGIVSIHLFLNPAGIPMAVVLLIIHLVLMFQHKHAYRGMLQAR